jgi:hypothetical protein
MQREGMRGCGGLGTKGAKGNASAPQRYLIVAESGDYFLISTLARVFSHSMRNVHLPPA